MTDAEYLQTQAQVLTVSGLVAEMDLAGFLRRIERAETMGVFLMPPLEYSRALPKTDVLKRLAYKLLELQRETLTLREEGEVEDPRKAAVAAHSPHSEKDPNRWGP